MVPEIKKAAEEYVRKQVEVIGDRVPRKDVRQAVKKVAAALEEVRSDTVRHGRRQPYTERGILRLPCARCGRPASQQWLACADGVWRPICARCDVGFNRMALRFMRDPQADAKVTRYAAKRTEGLVHRVDFRLRAKRIQFRAWRDERATGGRRRKRTALKEALLP